MKISSLIMQAIPLIGAIGIMHSVCPSVSIHLYISSESEWPNSSQSLISKYSYRTLKRSCVQTRQNHRCVQYGHGHRTFRRALASNVGFGHSSYCTFSNVIHSEAQASVPGASNKLGECLIE